MSFQVDKGGCRRAVFLCQPVVQRSGLAIRVLLLTIKRHANNDWVVIERKVNRELRIFFLVARLTEFLWNGDGGQVLRMPLSRLIRLIRLMGLVGLLGIGTRGL